MNKLNDLSPSEWIHWTKTCWMTDYPVDSTFCVRKELKTTKSPQAMRDIISFFTKEGDRVLDTFAGVGSTLIAALLCGREAVGIEMDERHCQIFDQIKSTFVLKGGTLVPTLNKVEGQMWASTRMINDDCMLRLPRLKKDSVDLVLCDPPHGPQGYHAKEGLGSSKTTEEFIDSMAKLGEGVREVLRDDKYWVIIMGDRYQDGEYIPLTYMLATKMQECGFKLKGIKVWINQVTQKNLKAFRVGESFVPNIVHENLIILRKE